MTSAGRSTSTDQARLHEVVDSVVSGAGYDLEELTVVAAGRRRMLRVVIDSDAGVDLDDAATVSRDISVELDAFGDSADPMGAAAYTLEVTSPGIGRPLTLPRHFRRARGRLLSITRTDGTRADRTRCAGGDQRWTCWSESRASTRTPSTTTRSPGPRSTSSSARRPPGCWRCWARRPRRNSSRTVPWTGRRRSQTDDDAEPEAFELEDDEDHEDDER